MQDLLEVGWSSGMEGNSNERRNISWKDNAIIKHDGS